MNTSYMHKYHSLKEFGKGNFTFQLYNSLVDEFFAFYNSRYQTRMEVTIANLPYARFRQYTDSTNSI